MIGRPSDVRVTGAELYLLPVPTRVPLKFGTETLTRVTCARVRVRVIDRKGRRSEGWGETPLSVQWGWPSALPYEVRLRAMIDLAGRVARLWSEHGAFGHALELGWDFVEGRLPGLWRALNEERGGEPMPWLAALIVASAFDVAIHDAFGNSVGLPVYETYGPEHLNRDLAVFLEPAEPGMSFAGRYPSDYLVPRRDRLRAWHLVGGLDPIAASELRGDEPEDGVPVLLADWIRRDGLKCLKVKLRGNDAAWDYERLVAVGKVAVAGGVDWLTADFNCTVREPAYVNVILDRLRNSHPRLYGMLLYVEQPFPYDLEANPIPAHSVSARKPLFLDESAHDWRLVRHGRQLGWSGVALKTCKTQSGALLSLAWARAHGMELMVQDLTNPMLAQLPHLLLAAHAGTIMGVETNAMQFYPAVSAPEAAVHPGCHARRNGEVDLSTLRGSGFGYRLEAIRRDLPAAEWVYGE
ncbi:MAG: mandelate racemase/muconate lactonizing enzyme family protein [Verrucomicrobiae bacterium]|nr:mandelate racemase/muconate lactonizing enzyme family protein [Verrucomicrobiae bacterium]